MTTAETLAVAVLKGDLTAARALAEHLCEEYARGGEQLVPRHVVTCPPERVRVVLQPPAGQWTSDSYAEAAQEGVRRWLAGEVTTLVLVNGWRVELYELPEPGGAG